MEKTFKVLPHMCKRQKQEIDQLLQAADDIGAAAVSVAAQGGMGYTSLVEARNNFKSMLLGMFEHYRVFLEEDDTHTFVAGTCTSASSVHNVDTITVTI